MAIGSIVLVFSSKGLALRVFLHPPEAEAADMNCPCHIHIKSSSFNGDPFQAGTTGDEIGDSLRRAGQLVKVLRNFVAAT